MNADKSSIVMVFVHPLAREVILDMVKRADVVVENFSPGVMVKYGFDATSLRALRPALVYCSISGFGQTGPMRSMQAYAQLINAFSGMMELECGGTAAPRASNRRPPMCWPGRMRSAPSVPHFSVGRERSRRNAGRVDARMSDCR